MWKRVTAAMLIAILPGAASAGPLLEAGEKEARALAQTRPASSSRGRLWTGIVLVVAGAALTTFGAVESREDESASDPPDISQGGKESNWGERALLGGGIASVAVGGVLLITGRRQAPYVAVGRGRIVARHTVRF